MNCERELGQGLEILDLTRAGSADGKEGFIAQTTDVYDSRKDTPYQDTMVKLMMQHGQGVAASWENWEDGSL